MQAPDNIELVRDLLHQLELMIITVDCHRDFTKDERTTRRDRALKVLLAGRHYIKSQGEYIAPAD